MTHKEVHLVSRPQGKPTLEDFDIVEADIPNLNDGQFLVQNEWMSVDPYMRGRMNEGESYVPPFQLNRVMDGSCVGKIKESKSKDFEVGDYVTGRKGWREFWVGDREQAEKIDVSATQPQIYLGVLGITGMTAYFGLKDIARLKNGERVFVSAASGAVGSVACQIAKIQDCYVVGSAGSSEKIQWLKDNAKIDEAFNYHDVDDVATRLNELNPEGYDVYFDNVGGDHLQGAIESLNTYGRIVACGMISGYNDETPQPGPSNLFKIIGKRLRMQGMIVSDYLDRKGEFLNDMLGWVKDGRVNWEETVTEGIENAPQAFIDMLAGNKIGKALVKLS